MKKQIFFVFSLFAAVIFSCKNKSDDNGELKKTAFIAQADSLISVTFDTIKSSLTRAIGENNFEGAIDFCNAAASPLTNTYSSDDITIERTSDKYRNPSNAPDSMEQRILAAFHQLKNKREAIKPVFEEDKQGKYHYFKPIILQAMCLNCHGSKADQIQPAVWRSIQQKYPADLAYDYKEGDLRGMWHVTYSKK
ncbi:MAG: Tll0287-like domain-containing protein [Chitinophagaceae bacterium]